jgi:hypothetical protein
VRHAPLRIPGFVAALAGAIALLQPLGAQTADECRVGTVAVSFSGRQLRVDTALKPGLPQETVQRLSSGLPTTSSWDVRLYADRGLFFWPDGFKDSRRYDVTATYRPLTSDYSVERRLDGKLLEARTVASRASALEALEAVRALPTFQMGSHLLEKLLYVKVRCTYGTGVALGVVPTNSATDWARSEGFRWTGE